MIWRLRRETAGSGAHDDLASHAVESGTPASLSFADGLAVQRALTVIESRAASDLKLTAVVARKMGVDTVVGFAGSKIWQFVAMFPPVPTSVIDAGYQDFADRWSPILDVSTRRACGSPARSIPRRSPMTTGVLSARFKPSGITRPSVSAGTRAT